jgi:hypothetical protein
MFGKSILNFNLYKNVKRGYKMSQIHYYPGGGFATTTGIKICLFGANANMGSKIAGMFLPRGTPMVLCHRNVMDPFAPVGDDVLYTRSNPYYNMPEYFIQYDTISTVKFK